jgi:hypothetical protein
METTELSLEQFKVRILELSKPGKRKAAEVDKALDDYYKKVVETAIWSGFLAGLKTAEEYIPEMREIATRILEESPCSE